MLRVRTPDTADGYSERESGPRRHHESEGVYKLGGPEESATYRLSSFLSFSTFTLNFLRLRHIYTMALGLSSAQSSRRPSPLRPGASFARENPVAPMDDEVHPVIHSGRVAVITGAGSGIGRAAAIELAK